MTLRFPTFLITLIAVLVTSVGSVAAQTPTLTSTVLPGSNFSLGPGQEESITWTITAAGAGAAAVTVTPSLVVPEGWTVQAQNAQDMSPFSLGGPQQPTSRSIPLTIALPPEASDVAAGELRLQAAGSYTGGSTQAPPQTVVLTYVAPVIPPAPVPPDYTWAWVSGILTSIVLIAIAIYFAQARRIGIVVDSPIKRFNIGTGGAYKVTIANPRNVPQNVQLRVTNLPKDWSAAFSFPVVPLNGHERSEVPLWVNVPLEASPNTTQAFRIQARPNRFSPWLITRKLQVNTLDVEIKPKVAASPLP